MVDSCKLCSTSEVCFGNPHDCAVQQVIYLTVKLDALQCFYKLLHTGVSLLVYQQLLLNVLQIKCSDKKLQLKNAV